MGCDDMGVVAERKVVMSGFSLDFIIWFTSGSPDWPTHAQSRVLREGSRFMPLNKLPPWALVSRLCDGVETKLLIRAKILPPWPEFSFEPSTCPLSVPLKRDPPCSEASRDAGGVWWDQFQRLLKRPEPCCEPSPFPKMLPPCADESREREKKLPPLLDPSTEVGAERSDQNHCCDEKLKFRFMELSILAASDFFSTSEELGIAA